MILYLQVGHLLVDCSCKIFIMDIFQVFFLSFLQGIVEFLPISSSGHLIILPAIFGWKDQGLVFDIAVHLGSLIAVLAYFNKELYSMISGCLNNNYKDKEILINIIIASIPLGLAGLFFGKFIEANFRFPILIASSTAFFGLILWLSDYFGKRNVNGFNISWKIALLIGLGQAIALIPGTSRSGITIAFALILGMSRVNAVKFSFLLSIPAIGMAVVWQLINISSQEVLFSWDTFLLSGAISGLTAYVVIHFFLRFIERIRMVFFAVYRFILASIILFIFI